MAQARDATFNHRQASFASGELAPALWGRTDFKGYHSGLKRCRNGIVDQHGSWFNRPGTQYVGTCQDSTHNVRLIPFTYASNFACVLEFGHQYINAWMNGVKTVITAASPYQSADLFNLKYAQMGAVMTITHPAYQPYNLTLTAITPTFSFVALTLGCPYPAPFTISLSVATPTGGTNAKLWSYGVTAVYADGTESLPLFTDTFSFDRTVGANAIYFNHFVQNSGPFSGRPVYFNIYLGRGGSYGGAYGLLDTVGWEQSTGSFVYGGYTVNGFKYVDGAITLQQQSGSIAAIISTVFNNVPGYGPPTTSPNFAISPPKYKNFWAKPPQVNSNWQTTTFYHYGHRVIAGGAVWECISAGLSYNGGAGPTGTSVYTEPFIFRSSGLVVPAASNAIINGMFCTTTAGGTCAATPTVVCNTSTTFTDGTVTWVVSPTLDYENTFSNPNICQALGPAVWKYIGTIASGATNYNYPAVVSYFDQRRLYANTPANPSLIVASQAGAFNKFDIGNTPLATDAVYATLTSNFYEEIRGLLPMWGLLALGSLSEWGINGGQGVASPITPYSFFARPQSFRGSSWRDPIRVGNVALFIQGLSNVVRELVFNFWTNTWQGADVSILSDHLFTNHSIVDWTYAQIPFSVVWAVREDGTLLGFTFIKEQEISAWHWHDTGPLDVNGNATHQFLSVCSIPGVSENIVYAVVNRGGTKYIEKFATRRLPRLATGLIDTTQGVFLDSSTTITPTVGQTIFTGLTYLNGFQVKALIDGAVYGPYMVSGGQIDTTLDNPTGAQNVVIIGLPYISQMKQLSAFNPGMQSIRSDVKNIYRVSLEVNDTRGLWVGNDYSYDQTLTQPANIEWPQRNVLDSYGNPAPYTGILHIRLPGTWEHNAEVLIQQLDPLPLQINAVEREIELGGDI